MDEGTAEGVRRGGAGTYGLSDHVSDSDGAAAARGGAEAGAERMTATEARLGASPPGEPSGASAGGPPSEPSGASAGGPPGEPSGASAAGPPGEPSGASAAAPLRATAGAPAVPARRGSWIGRRVAIVAGCRTPFVKSGTDFKDMTAIDLGTIAVREVLERADLDPGHVDGLVYGTVVPSVTAPNIAREVTFGAGLPAEVPAFTVSRACASANQAITSAADQIARGYADVVVAGGAESLTDIPILLSRSMRNRLVAASAARTPGAKLKVFAGFRPKELVPLAPAIAEPTTGETMGQSAERMAKENHIRRGDQDRWALRSHQLAAEGVRDGRLTAEIVPVYVPPAYDDVVTADNGIRTDTSFEKLEALPPVFDRKYGSVTAGNASPLTDGASAIVLMSEEKASSLGYEPLGYIRSWAYAALSPRDQLLQGPAYATPVALDRAGVSMRDIELWEMHEAFAAQVLSNLQALDSLQFARRELGRSQKVGVLDESRINVMGGSIAIGHPFGATGGRLTITLLRELRRRGQSLGLITVCAAGAMGFAMVLERA